MSFALSRSAQLTAYGPRGQNGGAAQGPQRRLTDAVEEVFRLALQRGDMATAEELLGVLEGLHERARVTWRSERRNGAQQVERARRDFDARKAARYGRY